MRRPTVLLVDDEEAIVKSMGGSLEDEGYLVLTAEDGEKAMELIKTRKIDVVFLDIWLPGMDGLEVLKTIKDLDKNIDVVIMTGHGTVNTAVQAVKLGAFDFLEKPFSLDTMIEIIRKIQERRQIFNQHASSQKLIKPEGIDALIGESPFIMRLKKLIPEIAKTDKHVLIQGETGTGKELVARLIHLSSSRKSRHMVKFNCAAFGQDDIERELFGYHKAKDSTYKKESIFKTISNTTIFIDAIDLLPLKAQKKLANFLKSSKQKDITTRIIAASIKDLITEMQEGRFHKALFNCFYNEIIYMLPLRNRRGDITKLLNFFLEHFCKEYGQKPKLFEDEAIEELINHDWPGNIKELKNMVEKLVVSVPTMRISLHDIPLSIREETEKGMGSYYERYTSMADAEHAWRRSYLLFHLRKNNRDIQKTAKQLHIKEQTLQRYINNYGIVLHKAKRIKRRYQHTLKRSMVLSGRGLHSGIKTGLILSPLPPDSGILFGNISNGETIPAYIDFVESTEYATSLKKGNAAARTVEHLLAVLHAYRISNLLVKINNELPIMDGSALDFCKLIEDAGIEEQDAMEDEIIIRNCYIVGEESRGSKFIKIEPSDTFSVHYTIQYPKPVGHLEYSFILENEEVFKTQIAPARTFAFLKDIEALEKRGLASGGRLNNFILIDDEKIINTELRFPDEFVRHKILDLIGDFYLLGRPIRGKITANMTGHTQNNALLRRIRDNLQ